MRNVNNTEDQLKEMLHSRVYKDGEWKTLKKKDQGPRDLSERSLGELLHINPNGEPSGTKRSPNKKKTKQQGNMIQEEQDDEDYYEYNRQYRQRPSQKIRNSQFNDLERDPFEGDGKTYYDDAYVVGEQDGQKVLLIPFENSNVLDGISTLNGQKKRESEAYASPLERQSTTSPTKPKGKKKKKKKKELNNLLAELEQEQMNNNEPKQKSLVIPEYQLMNRPYATLNKENDQPKQEKRVMFQEMDIPGPQEEYEGSLVREKEEQHANQLPGQKQQKEKQKSKYCNIF